MQTQFYVAGMSCDGCVKKARESLASVAGFESAEFDLEAGTATIEGEVDPQAVAQALNDVGYPSVVKSS